MVEFDEYCYKTNCHVSIHSLLCVFVLRYPHTHTGTLTHYYALIHVHTLNSIFVYTSWYMPEFIH